MKLVKLVIGGALFVGSLQVAAWFFSARQLFPGSATSALVITLIDQTPDQDLPTCVAIDPDLWALVDQQRRDPMLSRLRSRGVALEVASPTHHPPTGYLDRPCWELFVDPYLQQEAWIRLPLVSYAVLSAYGYDSHGYGVLMLQLGKRWLHVRTISHWI